ncbi:MAG: rubrerythrin family protein [Actinomycetota bacterium]|nr:rubrerythrin family protein [Actinomycetota bacterium]
MKEKSLANLQEAFAGESQANRKYLAFAKKADSEGYKQVAKLFRAAAEAETIHAHAHLAAMGGIKDTVENLKEAIGGETHEFQNMYPQMIKDAEAEGEKTAERSFSHANFVEEVHANLYKSYLENIDSLREEDIWVCPVCGMTFIGKADDKCPVCATPKEKYILIK